MHDYFDLLKGSTGAKNSGHEDTFGDLLRECRESAKKKVDEKQLKEYFDLADLVDDLDASYSKESFPEEEGYEPDELWDTIGGLVEEAREVLVAVEAYAKEHNITRCSELPGEFPTLWLETSDAFDMATDRDYKGLESVLQAVIDYGHPEEHEDEVDESKTDEEKIGACPRCGNELVRDEGGDVYCMECDWHPGDPEEVEEKKVTEQGFEEEDLERPEKPRPKKPSMEEPDPNEVPEPPDEVKEPEQPMEMRKEYLGKSEDVHFYFITTEGGEGIIDDFVIVDQEGVKKYSAKAENIEITEENIADFLIQSIRDVQIAQIERSIFMKYIYPKLIEEAPEEEEIIEEPEEEEEKEKGKKPLGPEEEEFPKESKKITDSVDEDKVNEYLTELDETMEILHEMWMTKDVNTKSDLIAFLKEMLEFAQKCKESKTDVDEDTEPVSFTRDEQNIVHKIKRDTKGTGKRYDFVLVYDENTGKATSWEGGFELSLDKMFRNEFSLFPDGRIVKNTFESNEDVSGWRKATGKAKLKKMAAKKDKKEVKESKLIEMKVTDDEGNEFDVLLTDEDTTDTVIDINGREFRFSPDFASMWRDEDGAISEEGLRELALDALANLEEEEYSEMVAKGAEQEVSDEEDVDEEPETEPEHELEVTAGEEEPTDDVDMSKPGPLKPRLKYRSKKKEVVPEEEIEEEPIEGKDQPGVRDGTGPAKDSAQRSISDVGKRKQAGEKCPKENVEVTEAFEDIEQELDKLDKMSIGELRDEVGEEADRLPNKDDLIDAVMHRKFGDKYVKWVKRQVGLEKKNNEGDNEMVEKKTPDCLRKEAKKAEDDAKKLRKEADELESNERLERLKKAKAEKEETAKKEGINPKPDDSEETKKKKLAEEEELNETDVAKGAKALIQLAKDALKAAEYSKAAEYCAKLAEIEAVVPSEAEAEAEKDDKPEKKEAPEKKDDEDADEQVDPDAVEEAKKDKDDKKAKAKKDKDDKKAKAKKEKEDKAKKDKEDKAKKAKKENKIQVESTEDITERKSMERLEDLLSM